MNAFVTMAGLSGLVLGSFCAALAHRYLHGQSIVLPPSCCPLCKKPLRPWELVPVLSYLCLRGRCAGCGGRISPYYPAVELAYALTAMMAASLFGFGPAFAVLFVYIGILLTASIIDWKSYVIPDFLSIGGAVPAIPCAVLWLGHSLADSVTGAVLASGGLWLLRLVFLKTRHKEVAGLGDVKYLLGLGGLCGGTGLPLLLLSASLSALAALGGLWLWNGRTQPLAEIPVPFGPFLSLGCLVTLFWGDWLWWAFSVIM